MLLYAPVASALTLRAEPDGSKTITGSFPYNSLATVSDGGKSGRPKKERFASHAFRYSVNTAKLDISLLYGHDFNNVLASKNTGSLKLDDTAASLDFSANIGAEVADTEHAKTALALIGAGLAVGLSPGFRIPPPRTVENAETVTEEDPANGNAIIRTINEAILYELSIVARPAYDESEVEARSWQPDRPANNLRLLL